MLTAMLHRGRGGVLNVGSIAAYQAGPYMSVYYDNVGGDHLEAALEVIKDFGCSVECGMISTYNATEPPDAPRNLFKVIGNPSCCFRMTSTAPDGTVITSGGRFSFGIDLSLRYEEKGTCGSYVTSISHK